MNELNFILRRGIEHPMDDNIIGVDDSQYMDRRILKVDDSYYTLYSIYNIYGDEYCIYSDCQRHESLGSAMVGYLILPLPY
jgi:hypothetical protein